MKTASKETALSVMEITRGEIEFCILGTTPLIYNAMSQKVWQGLLLPSGKKNAAERAGSLKHNPLQEYRDSVYRNREASSPTVLMLPTMMFKGSIGNAALDMPGAKKAQIGRLVHVHGTNADLYGVPQMFMSIVRSADMNATPDVRTRAIVPEWACKVSLTYIKPLLREQMVANLLAAAGVTIGVGDFRSQKGKGNYGSFQLVSADNEDFNRILQQRRAEQEAALQDPVMYDTETEQLYAWYKVEVARRGFKVAA